MSHKLPVNRFEWKEEKNLSKFNEDFIEKYDESTNTGIKYPETLFNSQMDLLILLEKQKIENVEKLICSMENKEKYVVHIRALKQALNHGLKF